MSKGGVANLEQGIRKPGWDTIQKLATALGVGVEAFAEEATGPASRPRGRPKKAPAKPSKKQKKRHRGEW